MPPIGPRNITCRHVVHRVARALCLVALLPLTVCGDDDPAGPSDDGAALDFSRISGDWAGWDVENEFWVRTHLESEAAFNEPIGSQAVGIEANGALVEECRGTLTAQATTPPSFTVEWGATCGAGRIELVFDPVNGTLTNTFFMNGTLTDTFFNNAGGGEASGTLTMHRGSDPGPQP